MRQSMMGESSVASQGTCVKHQLKEGNTETKPRYIQAVKINFHGALVLYSLNLWQGVRGQFEHSVKWKAAPGHKLRLPLAEGAAWMHSIHVKSS